LGYLILRGNANFTVTNSWTFVKGGLFRGVQGAGGGSGGSVVAALLSGLGDVQLTSPQDHQALSYDNQLGKWVNSYTVSGSFTGSLLGNATSASTASWANNMTVSSSLTVGNSQIGSISITGSSTTKVFTLSSFDGANFDYLVKSGSNMRAGNIAAVWTGTNVSFNETNTTDLGSTSTITFNVDVTGSLVSYISAGTWTIEAMYRALGPS